MWEQGPRRGRGAARTLLLCLLAALAPAAATPQDEPLKRWLDQKGPEARRRLADGYDRMVRDQRAEADALRPRLDELRRSLEQAARDTRGDVPHAVFAGEQIRLAQRRDDGDRQFREGLKALAETARDELLESTVGDIGRILGRGPEVDRALAAKNVHDADQSWKERKRVEALATLADVSIERLAGADARLALAYSVITDGYQTVKGGLQSAAARRELSDLKPVADRQLDRDLAVLGLRTEHQRLASRLRDLENASRQYAAIADTLKRGGTPPALPLPRGLDEVLWPSVVNRKYVRFTEPPPPSLVREQEPGGIKFSSRELNPVLFRADVAALAYDDASGHLVLVGGHNPDAPLLHSDLLAAALLLAASGGEPGFSLDPVNHRDFDACSAWVNRRLRALQPGSVVRRLRQLAHEGRAAVFRAEDGSVTVNAALSSFDPSLEDELHRELDLGERLWYSHEFLRYTEAGRLLYEADLALKQAVHGFVNDDGHLRALGTHGPGQTSPCRHAGRGDFAPTLDRSRRGADFASVDDIHVKLELAVRVPGTGDDDDEATANCAGCQASMDRFNGNRDGLRDRLLARSLPLGRLRQFFKAYFAAKLLIERNPSLRERILRSVQVPVRDATPERHYWSPVLTLRGCAELLDTGRCGHGEHGLWSSGGYFGGISFRAHGTTAETADLASDPTLGPCAELIRDVARREQPVFAARDGRTFLRVTLDAPPFVAPVAQIPLEAPLAAPDAPGAPSAPTGALTLLLGACALGAMLTAPALRRTPAPARRRVAIVLATALAALAAATSTPDGSRLVLALFAASALGVIVALLLDRSWAPAALALFNGCVAASSAFVLATDPAPLPAAAAVAAVAALALLGTGRTAAPETALCPGCRRVHRASGVVGVVLFLATSAPILFVAALAYLERSDFTLAPATALTGLALALLVPFAAATALTTLLRSRLPWPASVAVLASATALTLAAQRTVAGAPGSWLARLASGGRVADFADPSSAAFAAAVAAASAAALYLVWRRARTSHA